MCKSVLFEIINKSEIKIIELPIKDQLSVLFNGENFTVLLQEKFKREVKANIIADVYEGKIYKAYSTNVGPLSEKFPNNIFFVLNTDGVAILKAQSFLFGLYI